MLNMELGTGFLFLANVLPHKVTRLPLSLK